MQLHRGDVVRGALRLLDADGLDALTMRKLAAHLGVQAGALYWHFPNKQALLDAAAEGIVAEVDFTPPDAPWDAQARALAHKIRAALLAHRDGARLVAGTWVAEPAHAAGGGIALDVLLRAGFPPDRAGWALFALWHFILGHTIEEQAQRQAGEDSTAWEDKPPPDPGDPRAQALAAVITADPDERFDYGLTLFLDGISRQLAPRRNP
jgi:TetR/AcrR family tetracycline transcriptional repressor